MENLGSNCKTENLHTETLTFTTAVALTPAKLITPNLVAAGVLVTDHSLEVTINGVNYNILLRAV